MKRWQIIFFFPVITILMAGCSSSKKLSKMKEIQLPLPVDREFRAAWVATVANINWPSKPGLTNDQQQSEAIELLDFLEKHHFNAVILQVRPQCDALYPSELEPWSYFLTGQQGRPPEPFYDPLTFWIEAAHDRGIELHVWLNPYRAHHKDGKEITDQSIIKRKPGIAVFLKEGYWWLDPGLEETKQHSTAVVMDLVKRYDIDGVHFDDYFYPYPSYNGGEDFPDSASWTTYVNNGGKLSRGDWRRENVNSFIKNLYKEIKSVKPQVKFGLSPFGIWRPGYPESIGGFDQYEQLYADARLWLNKGWIDYFTPQLYWPINRLSQSFPILLGWWERENLKKRHLWPGISVGRDTSMLNIREIMSQIMITRGMLPSSKGAVHWSISSLTRNPNMATAILDGPYQRNALVPATPWLNNDVPPSPEISTQLAPDTIIVTWKMPDMQKAFRWIIFSKYGNNWNYTIQNRKTNSLTLPLSKEGKETLLEIGISSVDITGNTSKPAFLKIGETELLKKLNSE